MTLAAAWAEQVVWWVVGMALASFFGGLLILLAAVIYNWAAARVRAQFGVPMPSLARSMAIALPPLWAQRATLSGVDLALAGSGSESAAAPWIAALVGLAILSGALSLFLPTSYGRALLLSLIVMLLNVLVGLLV